MQTHRRDDSYHDTRELVESALGRYAQLSSRKIRVGIDDHSVTLEGVVGSYYHKQLAQESARSVARSRTIHNELLVIPAHRS